METTIKNISVMQNTGYKKFEELQSKKIIDEGDIIIYPEKNSSGIVNPIHLMVTNYYWLDICGNPSNLYEKECGSIGYQIALKNKPWGLVKKKEISKLQELSFDERREFFKNKKSR